MATTMTSSYFFFLIICIIIIILANGASSQTSPVKPRGLAIKLIHYDSIRSPYYNPKATISERAERAINSSLARVRSLSKIIAIPNEDDFRAPLIPANGAYGFLANISIGTPPAPQLMHIDTGSDLFWFQCLPCTDCVKQSLPLFDPAQSSTYSNIPCGAIRCFESGNKCDSQLQHCVYERYYLDNSSTAGNLASEQATFETSDEGTVKLPIEVFGCGHVNKNFVTTQESGVLGLSYGYGNVPTLVSQLGSKFSYCIGNIHDPQNQDSHLILGDGAIMEGDPTTMLLDKGFYFVELQGISVREKKLQIDPEVFKRGPSGGGVLIDSGTTFTYLKAEGYVPLQNEVENLMLGHLNKVSHSRFLCFSGRVERDLEGFPVVTLLFSGGAQLSLDTNSLFFQLTSDVLCMSILPITPAMDGESMIGVLAQQSYNVGYDIKQGKIFFQRMDCRLLESLV
ncbi:aspartic proteinase CDR1-like [Syzygium oleosum]|uniref:aspartic proteinase CDR1-like n=1 Tax=Syzygium oleosum TaxID=219896 RepID=UPI0024B9F8F9|nr:aspartic proteinase CDR1-like [Syzygium oleosum]